VVFKFIIKLQIMCCVLQ